MAMPEAKFFPSDQVPNPTYTAPANKTVNPRQVVLTVTADSGGPLPAHREGVHHASRELAAARRHHHRLPVADDGELSGGTTQCSATFTGQLGSQRGRVAVD